METVWRLDPKSGVIAMLTASSRRRHVKLGWQTDATDLRSLIAYDH